MSNTPSRKELTHDRIVDVAARAIAPQRLRGRRRRRGHEGGRPHAWRLLCPLRFARRAARRGDCSAPGATARPSWPSAWRAARPTALARFAALVEVYLSDEHLGAAETGCPVAALASEMPRQSGDVGDAARLRVAALVDRVRRALPEGADPAQAGAAAGTMVGALQLARALGGKAGKALLAAARQQLISQYGAG